MVLPKCHIISIPLTVIPGYHLGWKREEEREKDLLYFYHTGLTLSSFEVAECVLGSSQLHSVPLFPS